MLGAGCEVVIVVPGVVKEECHHKGVQHDTKRVNGIVAFNSFKGLRTPLRLPSKRATVRPGAIPLSKNSLSISVEMVRAAMP